MITTTRFSESHNARLVLPVLFLGFIAVFSGLVAAVLPWWLVFALIILPLLAIVAVIWPYFGLIGLIVLISGAVPSSLMPQVSVGPGKLLGTDMALGVVFALAAAKAIFSKDVKVASFLPYLKPVLLFLLCMVCGVAVAYFLYRTETREILNEGRVLVYWLVFLVPLYLARQIADLNRIAWGLVIVGLVLAVMVIIQFALGIQILENARVEDLRTLGGTFTDVTRSTAGGAIYFIIFALFFLGARYFNRSLHILVALPLMAILAAGIIATFGRGIWLTTAAGLCFIAWHLGGLRSLYKVAVLMCITALIGVSTLALFKPAVIDAATERFTSTFAEGDHRSSLGERFEENQFALKKIASSPIVGIGFGTPYKPRLDLGSDWTQVRYIHNAYLGIWLKMGLAGLVAVSWLVTVVFRRSRRLMKHVFNDLKTSALATATFASFCVPVVTSMTQPEWLTMLGVSFFALTTGIIASIERLTSPEPAGK